VYDPQGSVQQRHTDGSYTGGFAAYDRSTFEGYGALRQANKGSTGAGVGQHDPAGFGGQFGYYTDTETGLLCLTHRYYDPGTGKFINRDPIGYQGGANLYGFADGNPVNGSDPDGTSEDSGTGSGTVRLSLAAFIPQAQVSQTIRHRPVLTDMGTSADLFTFRGDNRGFSPSSSHYRLQQNVIINLRYGRVDVLIGQVGETHGSPSMLFPHGYVGTASSDGMKGSGIKSANGDFIVTLDGSVGIPAFHDTAPPIQYHFVITTDPKGKVKSIVSSHTRFPAFEVYSYQNGNVPKRVYGYDPRTIPIGPNPGLYQHTTR